VNDFNVRHQPRNNNNNNNNVADALINPTARLIPEVAVNYTVVQNQTRLSFNTAAV